jgi:hypothetical protein
LDLRAYHRPSNPSARDPRAFNGALFVRLGSIFSTDGRSAPKNGHSGTWLGTDLRLSERRHSTRDQLTTPMERGFTAFVHKPLMTSAMQPSAEQLTNYAPVDEGSK